MTTYNEYKYCYVFPQISLVGSFIVREVCTAISQKKGTAARTATETKLYMILAWPWASLTMGTPILLKRNISFDKYRGRQVVPICVAKQFEFVLTRNLQYQIFICQKANLNK